MAPVQFGLKRATLGILFTIILILSVLPFTFVHAEATYQNVVQIPVKQGIERGLEKFLERAFTLADERGADLIILDIDTPGGEVNAAENIGKLVRESSAHVIAFIDNQAFSAGTYIALNADQIIMTPGSALGAATPIDLQGNAAKAKFVSGWSEKMVEAAKLNNRDPEIARAMVEIDTEFPGLKQKGTVLSLGANAAKDVGYADQVVGNQAELYQILGISDTEVFKVDLTVGEQIARFVTNPITMGILLLIGMLGIVIEFFMPGFGIAGSIGVASFSLYFFGHYVAGFANMLHIGLFILGIIMVILEIFLPGGIVGTIGFISLIAGLVLAAYDTAQGLYSLGIAMLVTIIVGVILVKYYGVKGMWKKFILRDEQRNDEGYVAPKNQRDLIGQEGVALTPMRPSGTVKIENRRVDAVSFGDFIAAGTPVVVVEVEGTRVVVQALDNAEKE